MFPYDAVEGVLKGYDQLLNLVLDETVEYARGAPRMHASSLYGRVLIALAAFWVLTPICCCHRQRRHAEDNRRDPASGACGEESAPLFDGSPATDKGLPTDVTHGALAGLQGDGSDDGVPDSRHRGAGSEPILAE